MEERSIVSPRSPRFEYDGIQLEQRKENPNSLVAYFHGVAIGEVSLGGMFSWGKKWTSIIPEKGDKQLLGVPFKVSVDDFKNVQKRAVSLKSSFDEFLKESREDFNPLDRDAANTLRDDIDSLLKANGLNWDLLERLEEQNLNEIDPETVKKLFSLLNQIKQFKNLITALSQEEESIESESQQAIINIEAKEFVLQKLTRLESRTLAVLNNIPNVSTILPDFLQLNPMKLKTASFATGMMPDEEKKEAENNWRRGLLREKLNNPLLHTNKEFEKEGIDKEVLIQNAQGCIDFAFVEKDIGLAVLCDGNLHDRLDIQPYLEMLWKNFINNFRNEIIKENSVTSIADAKEFLIHRIDELNRILDLKRDEVGGSLALSLVWFVETPEGKKHAMTLTVGDTAVLHLKSKQGKPPFFYALIQPGGTEGKSRQEAAEFSGGTIVNPRIIDFEVNPGDRICLLSDGIAGNFFNSKQLATFLEHSDDEGDIGTAVQNRLDRIKSGNEFSKDRKFPIKENEELEEKESKLQPSKNNPTGVFKGLRRPDNGNPKNPDPDDISLIIIDI